MAEPIHVRDLVGSSTATARCHYCDIEVVQDVQPPPGSYAENAWVNPADPESDLNPGWEFATIDHVIPRSRGGEDVIENCVVACWPCNHRKRTRTPEEWGVV